MIHKNRKACIESVGFSLHNQPVFMWLVPHQACKFRIIIDLSAYSQSVLRLRTYLLYTTDVKVHRVSFYVGATRATCPRAKLSQNEHDKISVKCSNSCIKLSRHIPMKIAWRLKNSILPILKGAFKVSVLCFLFICNSYVSLGPISVATLEELRASLVSWHFLQLKEVTGKGTTSVTLSTSSRISITSAGVLSLSIVICASRRAPPTVAMAKLGNDVNTLHVPILFKFILNILHMICSIACNELDEHVCEWYVHIVYGISV